MRDGLGRRAAQQPQRGFGIRILCAVAALVAWCAASATESVPSRTTATAADGLPIAYDVRGSGETALVFVHCWACDRAFWREQLDAFASDHLVVSLDLGGHGESGTDREAWTIEGLAGDVIAVADALALDSMILVGHSMGGPVSLYAARSLGGRVRGVILLDTLHDVEAEVPDEAIEQFAQSLEDDFTGTMRGATQPRFADPDSEAARWVVERACAAHPEVAVALMRDFVGFDPVPLVEGVSVPIRAINAAPTAEGGQPTALETNREHCDFDAAQVEGVGHFLQLEKPDEVNRHLRAFVHEMIRVPALAAGEARTRDKVLGLGGAVAWGSPIIVEGNIGVPTFAIDGGIEFRIHPVNEFSLDFQFDIAGTLAQPLHVPVFDAGGFKTFFQVHTRPDAGGYFSAGPYIGFGDMDGRAFMTGGRIGAELHDPSHDFAMGMFARPGLIFLDGGLLSFEVYYEMSWIFYPPIERSP